MYKGYSELDFQADVVICGNGVAKVYKLLDNIEIIAVSRDMGAHTRHEPTNRQHTRCVQKVSRILNIRGLRIFDSRFFLWRYVATHVYYLCRQVRPF